MPILLYCKGRPGNRYFTQEVLTMVEVEKDYASKGVAGAGLGLGK